MFDPFKLDDCVGRILQEMITNFSRGQQITLRYGLQSSSIQCRKFSTPPAPVKREKLVVLGTGWAGLFFNNFDFQTLCMKLRPPAHLKNRPRKIRAARRESSEPHVRF